MHQPRRAAIITLALAMVAAGAAQPENPQQYSINVETRLGIVENRIARLEIDVARLGDVPTALARIEEKVTALAERAGGQGAIIEAIGLGVVMSIITGVISYVIGDRRGKKSNTP